MIMKNCYAWCADLILTNETKSDTNGFLEIWI